MRYEFDEIVFRLDFKGNSGASVGACLMKINRIARHFFPNFSIRRLLAAYTHPEPTDDYTIDRSIRAEDIGRIYPLDASGYLESVSKFTYLMQTREEPGKTT